MAPVIDWTKSIEYRDASGTGKTYTVRVVGRDGDNYVLASPFEPSGVGYFAVTTDGVEASGHRTIFNVPPPKKKAWVVVYRYLDKVVSATYIDKVSAGSIAISLGERYIQTIEVEYV